MSDESRNVLVVTFEDSAEPVKVCVCASVCAYMSTYMRAHMCVCMCGEPLLLPCLCVHACMCVCVCVCMRVCVVWCGWVWVGVGVGAYMYACVCRESREPLFQPCSFSCVGGSEGTWLITPHYCTSIAQMQFLAVKDVIEGEIQPLDQLPHCHDVDDIVKVCTYVCACGACFLYAMHIYIYMYIRVWLRSSQVRVCV